MLHDHAFDQDETEVLDTGCTYPPSRLLGQSVFTALTAKEIYFIVVNGGSNGQGYKTHQGPKHGYRGIP